MFTHCKNTTTTKGTFAHLNTSNTPSVHETTTSCSSCYWRAHFVLWLKHTEISALELRLRTVQVDVVCKRTALTMWFHLLQRKSDNLIAVCRCAVIVARETHYYSCEHVAALLSCSKWAQTSATLNVVPMKQIKNRGEKIRPDVFLVYWSHAVTHASVPHWLIQLLPCVVAAFVLLRAKYLLLYKSQVRLLVKSLFVSDSWVSITSDCKTPFRCCKSEAASSQVLRKMKTN